MPRPKPNKLHDELDALLDGRPVELTDELAPLAEAADALRVELVGGQLGPETVGRLGQRGKLVGELDRAPVEQRVELIVQLVGPGPIDVHRSSSS